MSVFIMEYRVIGYSLADGMRPDPKWGKKTFTVKSEDVGCEDINVLAVAAASPENTPDGYKLYRVRDRDSGAEVRP